MANSNQPLDPNSPPLLVAVGLLLRTVNQVKQVLISQRRADQTLAGIWEFPGGKVEPRETPEQALHRELQEELGIAIHRPRLIMTIDHRYTTALVALHVYEITQFVGEPYGAEGQRVQWISLMELPNYQFPEGNRAIVSYLQETTG